jgi:glutathione S-transferase
MADAYRIFGSEMSPYSVKVRSWFRYKGLPHDWIERTTAHQEEFQRLAKLPLIPLVVTPAGEALQDSTPIIETLERRHPEPPTHPSDAVRAFVSALLEEYGDEWGNKPMFHYRWFYPADQASAAERIARGLMPGLDADALATAAESIKTRMIPRLSFVGSSEATRAPIEASLQRQLDLLEQHFAGRPYLFGGRPVFGDFGLFAQLYECSTDPTPSALMATRAPRVLAWIRRMLDPRVEGDIEPWTSLAPTLLPFLRHEVGAVFLPWSTANARAIAAGEKTFALVVDGAPFAQEAQKYHAKSLAALRARYAAVPDDARAALDRVLDETGCLPYLR